MQFPVARLGSLCRRRSIRLVIFFALFCGLGSDFNLRVRSFSRPGGFPFDAVRDRSVSGRTFRDLDRGSWKTAHLLHGDGRWRSLENGRRRNDMAQYHRWTARHILGWCDCRAESDPNVVYVGMGEHAIRGVMTSHV